MADRYWVGGSGYITDTNHWSLTSGGAGGASAPTSSDIAHMDSLTVGQIVTLGIADGSGYGTFACSTMDWTGSVDPIFRLYTPSVVFTNSFIGCLGMTIESTGILLFNSATGSITSNGVEIPRVDISSDCTCTVHDDSTIDTLNMSATSDLLIVSGKTLTITSLTTSGTSAKSIQSTIADSPATISKASGTVEVTYCSIKDITATGGAIFNAVISTDLGGNTGWIFLKLITKIGGIWKNCSAAFVKIGGAWKSVSKVYVKINGAWKNQ